MFGQIAPCFKLMGRKGRFCKHMYISAVIKLLVSPILSAAIVLENVQQAWHDKNT